MTKHDNIGDGLIAGKVTYSLRLNVTRRGKSQSRTETVVIEAGQPFGAIQVGDAVNINELEGFPESHLTGGVVRAVIHTFSGTSTELRYVVVAEIDAVMEE
jgi:hypothetical protein